MQLNVTDQFDTVSIEDLERLSKVISLEGLSAPQFMVDSKARFAQFFSKTDVFFKQLKFQATNGHRASGIDVLAAVNAVGYVKATENDVIVPPGFTGMWLPYCKALEDCQNKAAKIPTLIEQYNNMLGRLVSDPSLLKSANGIPFQGDYTVGVYAAIETLNKSFFTPNNETYTRSLGSVVERVADISPAYSALNNAIQMDKAHPSSEVIKGITRSMELSKRLLPQMDDDAIVSKPVREQLIGLTFSVAREVEAYSVLLYRLKQFSTAMEDTSKLMKK